MTLNEARSQVAKLNAIFLEKELAVAVNPAVAFPAGDRTRVSWPQAKDAQGMFVELTYASISEYRSFFRGTHYTCLLKDGALVQISFDFKNADMVAHRFCFYPCPLFLPDNIDAIDWDIWNDLLEEALFAEAQALEPSGLGGGSIPTASAIRLRSPIRFDYESEEQTASESPSHVHLSDDVARIPVQSALSLSQFVHFVVLNFYPSYAEVLDDFAITHFDRCIRQEEEYLLHFDCRRHL
jgi:hypothetical protein